MYFAEQNPGRRCTFKRRLAFLLPTLILLCLAWLPAAAESQGPVIKEANLRLSPEYDDPGLLVILSGTFDNIASYPQQVSFPVPAAARGIQATEQDTSQTLVNREWTRSGDTITYALQQQPSFQVEYYMDRPPSGNDRQIKYSWRAPYAIKDLTLTVQQPARASNFVVTPKPDSSFVSSDGLTTYALKKANVGAGDPFDVAINYTKADQAPSLPRKTAPETTTNDNAAAANANSAPAPVSPVAGRQNLPLIPVVLIVAGLAALVGAAVYWLIERRRSLEPALAGRSGGSASTRSTARSGAPPPAEGETRFCRKCGRAFRTEDRFCGQCGAPRS